MRALENTIQVVLDVTRRGGRLLSRDAHTLVLADYDHVSMASLSLIVEQFPDTQIDVCQSTSSSSGYILTFHHIYTRSVYTSASFVKGVLVCLLLSLYTAQFGTNCLIG